ncbi:BTAD domain-containing putative transcriptional regulator [Nocardia vinacea]|uniref:BTAD domain-containing putative transcriptional regulator n=1 Tax=Nocardia vinacea TaxID=96468 RepID=UPI003AF3D626
MRHREQRWELMALELHRSRRQTQAPAALRRVRELLVDEVGVEPGARCASWNAACSTTIRRSCTMPRWWRPAGERPCFGLAGIGCPPVEVSGLDSGRRCGRCAGWSRPPV